ncbi:MAG: AEC family transporter [Clostridiaceae bacterium]|nr:AEC family transporter [Clostridiaceae bacterium]
MLTNLLTSLEVTLPIFAIIALGWLLRRNEVLNENFVLRTNDLIFRVALPAKLFIDVSSSDLRATMNIKFVSLAVGVTLLCILLAWIFGSHFLKEPSEQGAFIHGAFRGNFAYVGLTLLQNLIGTQVLALGAVIMATVVPIYNIAGVVILTLKKTDAEKPKFGRLLIDVVKTPMIAAILIAIPFSLLQIKLPFIIEKPLSYLSVMVAPLALLCVGAGVRLESIRGDLRKILPACAFKLILQPLLMVPAAIWLGLSGPEVMVLLILAGVPSAVNVYIITQKMGGDGEMASAIVVLSTALSIVTLTIWLFVLKTIGIW